MSPWTPFGPGIGSNPSGFSHFTTGPASSGAQASSPFSSAFFPVFFPLLVHVMSSSSVTETQAGLCVLPWWGVRGHLPWHHVHPTVP